MSTSRKIDFELEKSPDAFYLMRGKKAQGGQFVDDKEEYTFCLKSIDGVVYVVCHNINN